MPWAEKGRVPVRFKRSNVFYGFLVGKIIYWIEVSTSERIQKIWEYFFDTLWCHQTCLEGKSPNQMKVCSWEDHRTPHHIPALRVSSYRFHLSFGWRMSGCSWKILRLWCMWVLSTVPKIQSRETLPKSPKRPWNAVNIMNGWKAKLQKPSPNRHCLYTFCTILYFFYHRKPSNFRIYGEMRLPPREFEDFQVLPLPPLERKKPWELHPMWSPSGHLERGNKKSEPP